MRTGEHVAEAPGRGVYPGAFEVGRLQLDPPAFAEDRLFELVRRIDVAAGDHRHVLLQLGLGRPGVARPQPGEVEPADEAPPHRVGREVPAAPGEVHRRRHEHVVRGQVVEAVDERLVPQDADEMPERRLHLDPRPLQGVRRRPDERPFEQHRAGRHRRQTADEEVEVDAEPLPFHFRPEHAHLVARLGPDAADVRQGEVGLRERGARPVDPVEDLHHLVDAELVAGHLVDRVDVVADLVQPAQARQVGLQDLLTLGVEPGQPFEQSGERLAQELVDADPGRVLLHPRLLPEAELPGLDVEVQVEEQLLALVEAGRLASEQHVERRQPLLAVEQHQRVAVAGPRPAAAGQRRLVGAPHQQMPGGVLAVERTREAAHLVLVPDVAALELGQQDLVAADLVQQVLNRSHFVHPNDSLRPLRRRRGAPRLPTGRRSGALPRSDPARSRSARAWRR